ncbi:MAG TPA: hypothetical protein VFZ47_03870, partial [Chitinophagaceae bacterium]
MTLRIKFKTRQTVSRRLEALNFPTRELPAAMLESASGLEDTGAPKLLAFIQGIDQHPRVMEDSEVETLGDIFTQNILLKGPIPHTLQELINAIESMAAPNALALRKMFLVAEGGQFHINNPKFELNARIVFTWQKSNSDPPDVMLSTVPVLEDDESLLQLIAWSQKEQAFHFFERKNNFWAWAGNSFHALNPLSRGKGPFDSHMNGALVMKELKLPWPHWHSQNSTISRANFPADSEFNTKPPFAVISGAEELEAIVKTGVRRFLKSRIQSDIKNSTFTSLITYLRQITGPTTVNLTSSGTEFHRAEKVEVLLPSTFFFDLDGLEFALSEIDVFNEAIPSEKLEVSGALYKKKALQLNMNITSEEGIKLKGDTHFCFLVPERAFEDIEAAKQLVEQKIISAKILACILLVDFSNPVDSDKRSELLQYCPESVPMQAGGLDETWVQKITAANKGEGTPEAEFLSYWNDPNLVDRAGKELRTY